MANTNLDTFLSNQKSVLNTLHALASISLNNLEKVASHHLASSRRTLDQHFTQGQEILNSKDEPGALSLSSAYVQPNINNGIDYLRGLHEIVSEAQEQTISLLEHKHGEWHKTISATLEWYAQSTGHADATVAAFRSAVSAANSAFENAHKTARQVASIADAGVKAATSVTTRAIEGNSSHRKKAA